MKVLAKSIEPKYMFLGATICGLSFFLNSSAIMYVSTEKFIGNHKKGFQFGERDDSSTYDTDCKYFRPCFMTNFNISRNFCVLCLWAPLRGNWLKAPELAHKQNVLEMLKFVKKNKV